MEDLIIDAINVTKIREMLFNGERVAITTATFEAVLDALEKYYLKCKEK